MQVGYCLLFVLVVGFIQSSFSARWSNWRDITLCSAKPCKCYNDREVCEIGEKIQIRSCVREPNEIKPCPYIDGKGPIQRTECTSEDLCSSWTEWTRVGSCMCEPYRSQGIIKVIRRCVGPVGMKCIHELTGQLSDDMEERDQEECICPVTLTTPKPTTEPKSTTLGPICCEPEESQSEEPCEGILCQRRKREVDIYDIPCVPCDVNGNPITTTTGDYDYK